jgi:hypothetical protein
MELSGKKGDTENSFSCTFLMVSIDFAGERISFMVFVFTKITNVKDYSQKRLFD